MSLIKIVDVAHVRFSAPDLDRMQAFAMDFGFEVAERTEDALYLRGQGTAPYLHATHRGEPAFVGFAFEATSVEDLHVLARAEGVAVEPLHGPGGGRQVVLRDPDGFRVEVVAGRAPAEARPLRAPQPFNIGEQRGRFNAVKRIGQGPSQVMRLGHCVLNVSDFRRSEAWYKQRFGLITSDEIEAAPGQALGAFLRADRGEARSDHHTLFLLGTGQPAYNHAAFEVPDVDDLMRGHDHLERARAQHQWGIGRHLLGSQVFDYWRDPWGHSIEHWTDGDQMNAAWGSRTASLPELLGVQWGQTFESAHPPVATNG